MTFLTRHHHSSWPGALFPRRALACAVGAALLVFGAAPGSAQDGSFKLKAAFLANFTQYVDWPRTAFSSDTAPFVLGVVGDNPFGSALSDLTGGETIQGRKAVVQYYKSAEDVRECHVLFISSSEQPRLAATLRTLKGRNILTVSDIEGFTAKGGIIQFVTQNRIRFRINPTAARDANLTISSKLLRLADDSEPVKAK
jgi:hypothetical protein